MTRDHHRLLDAYFLLFRIHAAWGYNFRALDRWLFAKFGKERIKDLTQAEARQARRGLNAWRHSMEVYRD